jgi:capsular exopolysaccharide synthesis family protein
MSHSSANFNLRYVLRALQRRLPILLACAVLVPCAAVVFSLLQQQQYTAKASLLFRDPEFDQKLFGNSFVQSQTDPTREAATNLQLVSLPRIAAMTSATLGGVSEKEVSSAVSVAAAGQSDVATIQATASNPDFAAQLANTFANEYIVFRRDADRAKILSAQAPLQQQIAALPARDRSGAVGQPLQQRLDQLNVLASLQTGNAELVQAAEVPRAPSSPLPLRNGALGVFFGLLLAAGLVVLAEALDRRLRDPAEAEQMFERPLLAAVPVSPALPYADPGLLAIPAAEREALRMLSVNLRYFSLSRDIRSVLVTSADRNDGRSTVAWGLAVTAAAAGTRTLLIEADLRKPSFGTRFKLPWREGLTSVLAGDVTRAQAVSRLQLPHTGNDLTPTHSMDVLVSGPRPPDPTDLLQSRRMADFLGDVEDAYDLVIIDTPPTATVSDAVPLISLARGVIVVTRLGNTVRDHARRLRQQLDNLQAPILGVVVNSVEADPYPYEYSDSNGAPIRTRRKNGAPPRGDGQAATKAPRKEGPAQTTARASLRQPGERPRDLL